MRSLAPLALLLVIGCSEDSPVGQPAGLTAGGSGQAGSAPSAGASGASAGSAGSGDAGQAGQGPAGQSGSAGVAAGAAGGAGADGDAGQAGTAGSPQGGEGGTAGAPPKTPAELGCSFTSACIDGRDGYKCPASAEPSGCVSYFEGGNASVCCGEPKPATCDSGSTAGSTRATARNGNDVIGNVTLPAKATAWLTIQAESGTFETKSTSVRASSSPIAPGSVEVCVGYVCADGSDGVKACTEGQKVNDGINLCCVSSDYGASGQAPKVAPACPNTGDRLAYARFKSTADACIDVKRIGFTFSQN